MAVALPQGKQQFQTVTGAPGVGYKLYTYVAGTSTPKDTYTTSVGDVANTNPVIADARGEMAVYWSGTYDVVLKDSAGVTIWGPERLEDGAGNLEDSLAASSGSSLIGFLQAGSGAVLRTLQSKAREPVSILDFGADPTGAALCNTALAAAKLVCNTVYFPPGTYRIEGYNLQDMRLIGAGTDGANYGVFTSIIEGSGDIFIDANNFALEHLTIRNSAAGSPGKLIQVKDIDTGIGPITNCNFLKANYHIYHNSATHTIVGAAIRGCLFREALVYSRYYANAGLFQYSEDDCYTQVNKRGLFIAVTSAANISASVFELNDEGAVYVVNTVTSSDVIRGLKFDGVHFEHNGNVTPTAEVTVNVTLSLARIEFDSCGFYSPTVAKPVELSSSPSLRIVNHNCTDIDFNNIAAGTVITDLATKRTGETNGVRVTNGAIRTSGGPVVGDQGFQAISGISVTITGAATPTPVAMPGAGAARLVLVHDSTTPGSALLMLHGTGTIATISTSLTSITFTAVSSVLNGNTTGGAASRTLFFNYIAT